MNKIKKELLFSVLRLGESLLIFLLMALAAYYLIIAKDHASFVEAALLILLIRSNHE